MADPIVGAIAFDGISPFYLSVRALCSEDRAALGLPHFDFRVCGIENGPIRTDAGLTISVPHDLSILDDADIVIVPSWKDLEDPPPAALIDTLHRAHRRGALIVGLCLGTFAIAATALLSGPKDDNALGLYRTATGAISRHNRRCGRALHRQWRCRDVGRRRRRA